MTPAYGILLLYISKYEDYSIRIKYTTAISSFVSLFSYWGTFYDNRAEALSSQIVKTRIYIVSCLLDVFACGSASLSKSSAGLQLLQGAIQSILL